MQQWRWERRHLYLFIAFGIAVCLIAAYLVVRANSFSEVVLRSEADAGSTVPQAAPAMAALPGDANSTGATSKVAGGGTGTGAGALPGDPLLNATTDPTRMLIKTGTLGLVIKDVDGGFGQVSGIATKYGGEVLQYTATKSGEVRYMDIVIRVKSESFESAMADLRGMTGIVERKVDKAESQDVTEEYVDIQSQLTNLNLTEQQLRAIMEKATRTEDVLAVQREITNVRGQIEKLQGRKTYLERRTDMSNIAIRLETPPAIANPLPASGRSFSGAIERAWSNSLAVLETLGIAIVSIVVFCWWVFPILLVGWLALRIIRRTRPATAALTPPPSPPPAATSGD